MRIANEPADEKYRITGAKTQMLRQLGLARQGPHRLLAAGQHHPALAKKIHDGMRGHVLASQPFRGPTG